MTDREHVIAMYAMYLRRGADNGIRSDAAGDIGGDIEVSNFLIYCAEQVYDYIDAPLGENDLLCMPAVYEYEVVEGLGRSIMESDTPTVEHFKNLMVERTRAWFAEHGQSFDRQGQCRAHL